MGYLSRKAISGQGITFASQEKGCLGKDYFVGMLAKANESYVTGRENGECKKIRRVIRECKQTGPVAARERLIEEYLTHCSAKPRVSKWRRRFGEQGMAGLEDAPRPGKPETLGITLAEALAAGQHVVWRALNKEGIYLYRARSGCVSTVPGFTEKSATIIGLYLNPPLNALVLSIVEKPGIQALE